MSQNDNRNKTYRTGGAQQGTRSQHQSNNTRKGVDMLPHPEVLEAYNYVVDGSAKMILEMFSREQEHRHAWERGALKVHSRSTILGQVLGFVVALSIFVSATIIGLHGDSNIAAFIWVFGMAIIVMAGMVWMYAKSMGQRPLFARPAMRTHFRPEKEKQDNQAQA